MFGKPTLRLATASFLLVCACTPGKDAEIVGAVVIAELAQSQNALPSDISVDQVNFRDRNLARVEVTQRTPGARFSHRVNFVCAVIRKEGRWQVESIQRRSE